MPAPDSGARRNDLYTFNPDSTYVISDGSSNAHPGTWVLTNAKLFLDGRPDPVPLEFTGANIELAGIRHERYVFNGEDYTVRGILGGIEPGGVFMPNQQEGDAAPKVGDYALRYVVLGQADSFRPGASADAGVPVYVEFWNETEAIKQDEAGNGYRDDVVAFEATEYEVGPDLLIFHGYHPDWGDMYFSAQFDGRRVATQPAMHWGVVPDRQMLIDRLSSEICWLRGTFFAMLRCSWPSCTESRTVAVVFFLLNGHWRSCSEFTLCPHSRHSPLQIHPNQPMPAGLLSNLQQRIPLQRPKYAAVHHCPITRRQNIIDAHVAWCRL